MWLDDVTPEHELATQRGSLRTTNDAPEPTFWQGSGSSIGPGLLRGAIEVGASVESGFSSLWQGGLDLAAGALLPEPRFGGEVSVTDAEEAQQADLGRGVAEAVKRLRPDPRTTGLAGQLLGEAAAILPRTALAAAAGGVGAGALAAGAPAAYAGKQVAVSEGIDENTATIQGAIEGITVGIGAALPAARFVKPLAGDLAIAVGANVGLGVASRGATAELLESRGYKEQAAQYRALDRSAMAIDAVLGAAFFGIGRGLARQPAEHQVAAALSENNAQHAEVQAAPGVPVDAVSANYHARALDMALEQLSRGDPVRLPDDLPEAVFLRPADRGTTVELSRADIEAQALTEELPLIRAELERQAAQLVPNVGDLRAEQSQLEYRLDSLAATFSDRAKAFQGQRMSRKQAERAARDAIATERDAITARQQEIAESLDANRQAEAARADLAKLRRGEMPERMLSRVNARAEAIGRGYQRKPLADRIERGSQQLSIRQVATREMARLIDEADRLQPRQEPADMPAQRSPASGRAPQQDARPVQQAPADVAREGGGARQSAGADSTDTEVQMAQLVLDEIGDIQVPTGAIDADGNPVTVSARELMAEADSDIQRAMIESRGIDAAATCFLQRGDS